MWTGRRDRRGIPIYVFHIRRLDSKTVSAFEKASDPARISKARPDGNTPAHLLSLFALYENLTRFVLPMCSEINHDRLHPHTPVTMSTNIVDVTGVSLRMFWNLKAHMQAASVLATAHYPETLDSEFPLGRAPTRVAFLSKMLTLRSTPQGYSYESLPMYPDKFLLFYLKLTFMLWSPPHNR